MKYQNDKRIVLTLDAGGTNFVFSAVQGGHEVVEPVTLPSNGNDLGKCLATMQDGFGRIIGDLPDRPVAISFAFPGPADYPNGIIGDQKNLPAFNVGGVALGPYLQEKFNIPVFINNDGDLFVYGEAMAGLLPKVNQMLSDAGSPKRFKNLFGVTLGTGFGAGIVTDGRLYCGDNSGAGEIWATRNKRHFNCFAEEGASIRAVKGSYARLVGIPFASAPEPKEISMIAQGNLSGDVQAAQLAFAEMGEIIGEALANAMTLLDGLIVIGGGLSKAYPLFINAVLAELNGTIENYKGEKYPRIVQHCYNLESVVERDKFLCGQVSEITVPGTNRKVRYDSQKRIGIAPSVLDTSKAVSIGAYVFALDKLE